MANSFAYTKIGLDAAVAVPGQAATPSQSIYTPITYVAGAGGCIAGRFVWPNTSAGCAGQALGHKPDGYDGRPLGLVERVVDVPNYDPRSQATNIVPEGQAVTIAVRGDYFVHLPGPQGAPNASAGQAVFVDTLQGTVMGVDNTDSAAVSSAVASGYQETSWRFVQDCTAGGIALISNWANQ